MGPGSRFACPGRREWAHLLISIFKPLSLRANGSRECAPDDRLREAIHSHDQTIPVILTRREAPSRRTTARAAHPSRLVQRCKCTARLAPPAITAKPLRGDDGVDIDGCSQNISKYSRCSHSDTSAWKRSISAFLM